MSSRSNSRTHAAPDAESLANELRPILNRLSRHLKRQTLSAGASTLDVFILGMVKNEPGIGVTRLAEMEDTTRPTMSAHVKRLRNAGWLDVDDNHSTDQRRSSLVLTEAGRSALDHVRARSNEWLSRRIGQLTSEERATLAAAMPTLAALMTPRGRKMDDDTA